MPFEIVRNDITKMQVDAIVNTANPRPIVGGGVDRAIHQAAGPKLLLARREIGDIPTGEAYLTPAYGLPSRVVIHTVGPVWGDGKHGEREKLADCYRNSLTLAAKEGCESVAFPLISAGIFGCPPEIAIAVAIQAIRAFLADHELTVYLVVFDEKAFQISSSLYREVKSFLDERYIAERMAEEYREEPRERGRYKGSPAPAGEMVGALMDPGRPRIFMGSIARRIGRAKATFSETLLQLIDKSGKTDPEVYKKANVDRKLFSKIRNNPAYKPSKSTALAFAVALELDLEDTEDFLARAGFAFSPSSKADIIVEYFIERGQYDIFTINETLFAFEQPLLGA